MIALAISLLLNLFQPNQVMFAPGDNHSSGLSREIYQTKNDSWNTLLRKHVDPEGSVNYRGFAEDRAQLEEYLAYLGENSPGESATKEEKLVYYINLYNAATVLLIVENYPVGSIKEIKSPWERKWIKVGSKTLSLNAIEHKMLRKLDEPRIHFAINCASYSCPKLHNKAYTLENLESLLDKAAREFINDPKHNRIDGDSAEISQLFKWYKADFTTKGSLVEYLNRYSETPIQEDTKIQYIKYDWSLNENK